MKLDMILRENIEIEMLWNKKGLKEGLWLDKVTKNILKLWKEVLIF